MDLADSVASKIISLYKSFGVSGKPKLDLEWTLLSGFVIELNCEMIPVSVATGTKCLGKSIVCPEGTTVNDSHAEVLARRGLLKYLYGQVKIAKKDGKSDIFLGVSPNNKCLLVQNLKIHFYTSHVPCGDASIIEMSNEEVELVGKKRKLPQKPDGGEPSKKPKADIHRTGAKTVPTETRQDPKQEGVMYHVRGAVRTKPGRGDPTQSLSCSDKIARWIFTGLQGALLSQFIEDPIRIDSLIIGGDSHYSKDIIEHALIKRSGTLHSPNILRTNLTFEHSAAATNSLNPCPASIIWINSDKKPQVSVEGKILGCTKKNKFKGCLTICRRTLFREFLTIAGDDYKDLTYREAKDKAVEYQEFSQRFKNAMGAWAENKTHNQQFKLQD